MSDSASTNESMIWCAKTGELQSLKTLLKEVLIKYLKNDFYSINLFFFVQHPGKVNEQMNGRSLLHYAADAGNFDVLKELVDNGANVNVNNRIQNFILFFII